MVAEEDVKTDVQLAVLSGGGTVSRLEVIEGPTGRRQWSEEEKARIVAESLMPGARVTHVARAHGVSRWQIYDWRAQFVRAGKLTLPEPSIPDCGFATVVVEELPSEGVGADIELVVGDVVVRATPGADDGHLLRVLRVARAAASQ
ncbi:MAG: transposase [Novosphingobium sp.]|nr:transposase [Novosphingobium sp.]